MLLPADRRAPLLIATFILSGLFAHSAFAQATTEPPSSQPRYEHPRNRDERGFVVGPSRVSWWNDAVFYEIFVRSFQDSSTGPLANDGIGDLRGLIERLDYLNDGDAQTTSDLGITGLWLMPIQPSNSYHGYDVTSYYGVSPDYGTDADLQDLLDTCRARGIRVILDFVPNHSSHRHPWFVDAQSPGSVHRDWYIWSEFRPGYRGPWGQQVWHPLIDPRAATSTSAPHSTPASRPESVAAGPFFYGLFGRHMPDLNFRNDAATAEMLRIARHWLTPPPVGVGVDGLRLDAIRHLIEDGPQQDNTAATHAWLECFYADYKRANPDALTIGEVWASTPVAASYVSGQLDLTFEFELADALIDAANTGVAAPLIAAQELVLRHYPPNQYGRFLTNHDQTRVASRLHNDPGKLRVAAALLLLGPGVPFLYYAEEVGQPGRKPDPDLRTPMPWNTDERVGFTSAIPWRGRFPAPAGTDIASQTSDPHSLLSWYRTLIAIRTSHRSIRVGDYFTVRANQPGVIAFLRTDVASVSSSRPGAEASLRPESAPATAALVVINLTSETLANVIVSADHTPMRGRWQGIAPIAPSDVLKYLPVMGELPTGAIRAELHDLPPHAAWIFPLARAEPE